MCDRNFLKVAPTPFQCATGSKILTELEPDRIRVILVGTGPDYKPEKFNRIRPDWPDFLKTLTLNLQVTNLNMAASGYNLSSRIAFYCNCLYKIVIFCDYIFTLATRA